MARRKRPEGETPEQTQSRQTLEKIADAATRSEKVAWDRKMDNMVSLIAKLRPIEDQMLELMAAKQPILDDIAALRLEMVRDCVHPYNHLVDKGMHQECKFCGKTFRVLNHDNAKT